MLPPCLKVRACSFAAGSRCRGCPAPRPWAPLLIHFLLLGLGCDLQPGPQGLYSFQVLFLASPRLAAHSSPLFLLPLGRERWKEGAGAKERVSLLGPGGALSTSETSTDGFSEYLLPARASQAQHSTSETFPHLSHLSLPPLHSGTLAMCAVAFCGEGRWQQTRDPSKERVQNRLVDSWPGAWDRGS